MPIICIDSPLGTLPDLSSYLTFPPFPMNFSALAGMLPSVPVPLIPSISMPNLELYMVVMELQSTQIMTTILSMVQPMLDLLHITDFFPPIPGLPSFNLITLLSASANDLIAAVKALLAQGISLPFLPSPILPALDFPDLEVVVALQLILRNYAMLVVQLIEGLVKQVTDKLVLPGLPSLPTLPTMEEVKQMLMALLPDVPGLPPLPDVEMMLAKLAALGMSVPDLFALPGFLLFLCYQIH